MISCLKRTNGNADFHQIVDFLNASTIKYSLTISPTIYASYIEQFWATAKSKIVNNETQIHAKVDGKTIVISESSVRSNLHFNDEDGVASLTNFEILENLALMGYEIVSDKLTFQKAFFSPQWKYLIHTILHCLSSKSTAWNEFSTNIASAVICLANNQKFNFSKLIFDGMLRNLDPNSKKFLMYPRFLQLFLNNQVKNLAEPFNDTYETPKHTQKVFANMRRKGKSFSGTVTPLFASMLVPQVVKGEGSGQPSEPQPPPSTAPPSQEGQVSAVAPSHPQKTQTPRQAKRGRDTEIPQDLAVPEIDLKSLDAEQDSGNILKTQSTAIPNVPLSQEIGTGGSPRCQEAMGVPLLRLGGHTPGSDEGRLKQDKLTNIVTALSQKVEGLESDLKKTKKLYATTFKKLINRVKSLEDELKFQNSKSKRRRLTLFTSEDEEDLVGRYGQNLKTQKGFGDGQEVSTAAQVSTASTFVSIVSPQRNTDTTADDLTLAKILMEIRKSAAKDKAERQRMAQVHQAAQGFTDAEWDDVLARVAADEDFVQQLQAGEKCSEEDLPMKLVELVNQRKKFFAQQRAEAKRNKPMTPAQQKDYMSNYIKNQEGGYSIKQLKSLSFEQVKDIFETTMRRVQSFVPMGSELEVQRLKRAEDDLVKLWDLVKERFSTTDLTDDKEKELWVELKRLFEPDNDDILWKLQRYMHDPLVWRLYDTCGVHHVSSVRGHDIFMLVEKKYPLTRGTLGLMMVVRLLVEPDSEMSREVLRKFFYQANIPRQGGLLGIKGFYNLMLLVQVCAAAED
ncbi:hypothetical protein Tco_0270774 [Tanacetum coccineum]